MLMSEPLSPTTRKNPSFLRVNPQNLKEVRVPLTKTQNQSNTLTLLILFLLLLPLLLISARGRGTTTLKILALPKSPNQPPTNLPPEDQEVFDPYAMTGAVSS
jgi:hypothetical protein